MTNYTKEEQEFILTELAKGSSKKTIIDKLGTTYYSLNKYLDNVDKEVVKEESEDIVDRLHNKLPLEKVNQLVRDKLISEYQRLKEDPNIRLNYTWFTQEPFFAYFYQRALDFYNLNQNTNFKIVAKDNINIRRGNCKIIEASYE